LSANKSDERPESEDAAAASQVGVRGDYILTLERDYDVYFEKDRPAWRGDLSAESDEEEDKEEPTASGPGAGEDGASFAHKSNMELMADLPRQVRRVLYSAVNNPWFDRVILSLVGINCIVLALDTPNLDPNSALGGTVAAANIVFVVLFSLEAATKIVALGLFVHQDSYFRSPWNWLDFGIVIEGLISTFFGGDGSLSGLRAFRVLRPLKTVSRLEGLKVIVNALLASMPLLFNTMIVVSFYFLVFGIVGVQVWSGQFHNRCFVTETGLLDETDERLCSDETGGGAHSCGAGSYCGKWTANPQNDVVSFDNVLWAFNTIFASITLEGWTAVMYHSMDTVGWWTVFYWVLLIVFGAFILMNLTLAVILTKFRESVEEQEAQKAAQAELTEREARLQRMTKEYYEARRRDPGHAAASRPVSKRGLSRRSSTRTGSVLAVRHADAESRLRMASSAGLVSPSAVQDLLSEADEQAEASAPSVAASRPAPHAHAAGRAGDDSKETHAGKASAAGAMSAAATAATEPSTGGRATKQAKMYVSQGGEFCEPPDEEPSTEVQEPTCLDLCLAACIARTAACCVCVRDRVFVSAYQACLRAFFQPAARLLYPVVTHPIFENAVLLCIVANTISLSIEHYGMDAALREGLSTANAVFAIIFAVEMAMKLLGLGISGYVAERFNIFDGVIVVISLVELGVGGDGAFAAFRTVRIARVLKIAKYLESMRMIAEVVRQSLESFSYIALLLLLFCFIYSVLGMQLFGGIFDSRPADEYPRNNFDDLYSAFVTVFQILAGEAWNEIMYDVIGATGQPAAAMYFISWVILGQFILLNLFLAVLLDNFSDSDDADDAESSDGEGESSEDDDDSDGGSRLGDDDDRDDDLGLDNVQEVDDEDDDEDDEDDDDIGDARDVRLVDDGSGLGTTMSFSAAAGAGYRTPPSASRRLALPPAPSDSRRSNATARSDASAGLSTPRHSAASRRARKAMAVNQRRLSQAIQACNPASLSQLTAKEQGQAIASQTSGGPSAAAVLNGRSAFFGASSRSASPALVTSSRSNASRLEGGPSPDGTPVTSSREADQGPAAHAAAVVPRERFSGVASSSSSSSPGPDAATAATAATAAAAAAAASSSGRDSATAPSGNEMRRTNSAAGRIAALFTGALFSSSNKDDGKVEAERRLKRRRKLAVKMILRRFRAVWLKVDEARSSLGSYAFKRPHHEAALMALLPPPEPGVMFGGGAFDPDQDAGGPLEPEDAFAARRAAAQRMVMQSQDSAASIGRSHSTLEAAAHIVSQRDGDRITSSLRGEEEREQAHADEAAAGGRPRKQKRKGKTRLTYLERTRQQLHDREAEQAQELEELRAQARGEEITRVQSRRSIVGRSVPSQGPENSAGVTRALHVMEEVGSATLEVRLAHAIRRERRRANALKASQHGAPAPSASPEPQAAAASAGSGAAAAAGDPAGAEAAVRMAAAAPAPLAPPPVLATPAAAGADTAAAPSGRDSAQQPGRLQLPAVWDNETWAVGINPAAPSMADVEGIDAEERKRVMLANVIRMWRTKDNPMDRMRRREAAFAAAEIMGPAGRPPRCTPLEAIAMLPPAYAHAAAGDVDFTWETLKARALLIEATITPEAARAAWRGEQERQRITHVPGHLEAECRSRLLGQALERDGVMFDQELDDGDATAPPSETPGDKRKKMQANADFAAWHGNHLCCFPRHGKVATTARFLARDGPLVQWSMCGRPWSLKFDTVILFLIILSSILLAVEGPPPETLPPVGSTAFSVLEIFFTVVFGFEIVLKVLAFGFAGAPGSYLSETWNIIDFVVVISSVLNLSLSAAAGDSLNLGFLRTLRLLRCLRPLRVISRNQGMRVVVTALLRSVTDIGNVMVVLLLVWLMFAILGVQLFAGKLHTCSDPAFPPATSRFGVRNSTGGWAVEPCSPEFSFVSDDGESAPREWKPMQPNFDSVFEAILLLFITSSGEGWPGVMFACADIVEVDVSPKKNNSPASVLFFVAFIVVGSFFFLNLFTGVVFDNFLRLKKEMDSSGILTDGQREWVRRARDLLSIKPERTIVAPHRVKQSVRRAVFDFTQHPVFQNVILVAIVLNVCTLAVNFYGEPPTLTDVLEVLNYFFTALFILEAVLKIFALSFSQYAQNPWNRFDFVVVIGSILDIIFSSLQGFDLGSLLGKVFRIARVLRVIRLAKNITGLRRLIVTLVASIPALINVGALLLLLFFIYAIMGVQSFGRLTNDDAIDVHANFRTFSVALLTLFRISTGEGWEGFLFDTTNGGHFLSWIYFVSFVTIASFVMVNLFITIIVEEFETAEAESDGMSDAHLEAFRMVWRYFDPQGEGRIRVKDLEHFLRHLPEPMGIPVDTTSASGASLAGLLRKLQDMDLDSHGAAGSNEQWVYFHEVLSSVHRTSFKARVPGKVLQDLHIHPVNVKRAVEHDVLKESAKASLRGGRRGCCPVLSANLTVFAAGSDARALESISATARTTLPVSKIMATVAIRQAFQDRIARSRKRAALRRKRELRRRRHLASIAEEADRSSVLATSPISGGAASPLPSGPLMGVSVGQARRLRVDLRPNDVERMPPAHLRVLARRLGVAVVPDGDPEDLRSRLRSTLETSRDGSPTDVEVDVTDRTDPHVPTSAPEAPGLAHDAHHDAVGVGGHDHTDDEHAGDDDDDAKPWSSHPAHVRPPSPPVRRPTPLRDAVVTLPAAEHGLTTPPQQPRHEPRDDAAAAPGHSPTRSSDISAAVEAIHTFGTGGTGPAAPRPRQAAAPPPVPVPATPPARIVAPPASPSDGGSPPPPSGGPSPAAARALAILAKHRKPAGSKTPGSSPSAFASAARLAVAARATPTSSPSVQSVLDRLGRSNPRVRAILERSRDASPGTGGSAASGSPASGAPKE